MSTTTICPWCLKTYDSQDEWREQFPKNHPHISTLDRIIPILNTPRKD